MSETEKTLSLSEKSGKNGFPAIGNIFDNRLREIEESREYLMTNTHHRPKIAIICGTGLGTLAEELTDCRNFPYEEIPHCVASSVKGHVGQLVFGKLAGIDVVCMQGRIHSFEGHPMWKMTYLVRVFAAIGVQVLIVTNAAGGLNPDFKTGDVMIIKDHLNLPGLAGLNPLIGLNDDRFGTRFPAVTEAYDRELRRIVKEAAKELKLDFVKDGVYCYQTGPCFESVTESRLMRLAGVDVAGYVQLDVAMLNVTKYEGETVRIRCEITGFPLPRYRWRHNGVLIPDSSDAERGRRDVKTTPWGSRLKIEDLVLSDSGIYTCEGYNSFEQHTTTGHLDIIPGSNPNKENNAGQRSRLFPSSADEDEESNAMETNIDVKYEDMDDGWRDKWAADEEDEELEEKEEEDGDWSSIEPVKKTRHHSRNSVRDSNKKLSIGGIEGTCQRYHGNLCSRFISNRSSIFVTGDRARQSVIESHLAATLTLMATSKDGSTECLEEALPVFCRYTFPECDVSRTKLSTRLCLEECEEFERGICREPYRRVKEHNPAEGSVLLIDCQRLKSSSMVDCVAMTSSERRAAKNPKDKMDATLFIVLPSVGLPFLVAMATILVLLCCRTSRTGSGSSSAAAKATSIGGPEADPMLHFKPKRRAPLIEVSGADVTLLRELGEGAYGRLYAGSIYVAPTASDCSAAFIKVLSDRSDPSMHEIVRQEALRLLEINHPNIVRIFGLSLGSEANEPTCMLYEYMESVDLRQFLLISADVDHERTRLTIIRQVAAAAEYLTSRGLVHRDLAARNVLVAQSLCVKLSDFGLCRYPYDSDYYPMDDGSLLPVRWMSPEALHQGQFSEASDVWAFGVLLWEIYNPGSQPYVGQSDEEVVEALSSRRIGPFACSERCPQRISALAMECWNDQPLRRPRFRDIHEMLRHLEAGEENAMEKGAEPGQLNETPTSSSNNNTASTNISPTLPCPLFAPAPYYYPQTSSAANHTVQCYMPLLASPTFVGQTGRMFVNRIPFASMPNSPAKMPPLPPLPPPPPPPPPAPLVSCSNPATVNSNGSGKYWYHWSPPAPASGISNVV